MCPEYLYQHTWKRSWNSPQQVCGQNQGGLALETPKGRTAIQRDLGRLEEWAKRSRMKFSKDKVLYLRVINSLQWYRLGSNSADSHLGLTVERRLNRAP